MMSRTVFILLCSCIISAARGQIADLLLHPESEVGVVVGEAGSLTCVAYGQPQPNITWLRDGSPIRNDSGANIYDTIFVETNRSFVISILEVCLFRLELEGNYSCYTENKLGNDSFPFRINVTYDKVRLTNYSSDKVAHITGDVMFSCTASGVPLPAISWYKDGSLLDTNISNITTIVVDNSTLTATLYLSNLTLVDAGVYICNATDSVGGTETRQFSLTLQSLSLEITPVEQPVIGVVTRDDTPSIISINFTIEANPEVVPANILWTYVATTTMTEQRIHETFYPRVNLTMDRRSITLRNLTLSDAGTFTLSATNEAGTHNASVTLIIHVEPRLIAWNYSDNEAFEKTSMSFWCLADGEPSPRIIWIHNDSLILVDTSPRHQVDITIVNSTDRPHLSTAYNSSLTVGNLRLRDAGSYRCRVDPSNIDKGRADILEDPFEVVVFPVPMNYCEPNPCMKGGNCSNTAGGFTCICDLAWEGATCERRVVEYTPPVIYMNPHISSPLLLATINVTCEVIGSPEPIISWYKDGQLLRGRTGKTLVIEEVSLQDRGSYHCEAVNSNSDGERNAKASQDTILNIEGIVQYKVELGSNITTSTRRKRQIPAMINITVDEIASRLSGMTFPTYNNATVYSVTQDPLSTNDTTKLEVIVTLTSVRQGSPQLKNHLLARIRSVIENLKSSVIPKSISRFDGCEEDETILPSDTLNITLSWPETNLGQVIELQCPCGTLSAETNKSISNSKARRECGGNFTHGGVWETAHVAPCNFSQTTRRLCQIAELLTMPEEAVSTLDNITSNEENIGSTEIGVTTILLEALTATVSTNQTVNFTTRFLTVVDNLLDAKPEEIQMSQENSNSSARILDVVETVSERIPLPENTFEIVIPLTSFAIAVKEVDPNNFNGQVFSAGLGNDFNFDSNKPIDSSTLQIDKEKSDAAAALLTASLKIPAGIFKDMTQRQAKPRITNSVFLTDALFSRRTNSSTGSLEVGGIIMAAALSNKETVENLTPPVSLTFLKKPSLENGTNTTCRFWDFLADDGRGDWSVRGCNLTKETKTSVMCECNHLTNFAILLDPSPATAPAKSEEYNSTLSAASYIGAVLSIFSLLITLITYLSSKKLRGSEAGQLLMNLSLALLGLYVMYIVSILATKNQYVCAVAGGLLHYFMLATFLAMGAEAVSLYTKLVLVLGVPSIIKNKFVLKAALITWIFPFVVVLISEAPDWTNYYSADFCRPYGAAFYGGLMVPFLIVYIFNWLLFILIFVSLLRKKALTRDSTGSSSSAIKLKQNFIIALILSLLFGLGWGVGLVATTSIPVPAISYTLQTIFVFFTSFQGLLIFIMHCVRSAEARSQWKLMIHTLSINKISLDSKKSMTSGHISSDYSKGTHGKFDYSTLSSAAHGSQTLQRIFKKEGEGKATLGDTSINEQSICESSMTEPTEVDPSSNSKNNTNKEQAGALAAGKGEEEMKEGILKTDEMNADTDAGEAESIISKFEILWLKGEESANTSCSSLSGAAKRLSRQSAVAQLSTGDIPLRATSDGRAASSDDKALLIEETENGAEAKGEPPTSAGENDYIIFQ